MRTALLGLLAVIMIVCIVVIFMILDVKISRTNAERYTEVSPSVSETLSEAEIASLQDSHRLLLACQQQLDGVYYGTVYVFCSQWTMSQIENER